MVDIASVGTGISAISTGITCVRESINLIKDLKNLPKTASTDAISKNILLAERQLELGEGQIALALGYKICHCQFPPKIMLKVGTVGSTDDPHINHPVFKCDGCGEIEPRLTYRPNGPQGARTLVAVR